MGLKGNFDGVTSQTFQVGVDGPVIRQGDSVPSDSLGNDGDIYIQHGSSSDTTNIFQKRGGKYRHDSRTLDTEFTTIVLNGPVSETNIVQHTIVGDLMKTDGIIRSTVIGLFNTSGNSLIDIRGYLGTQKVRNVVTVPNSTVGYLTKIEVDIANVGAVNSQKALLKTAFHERATLGAPLMAMDSDSLTVDTSVDQSFRITMRILDLNGDFFREYGAVELYHGG